MISRGWVGIRGSLHWLGEHGFLDQTPTVGQNAQIVKSATGWHYAAAYLGANLRSFPSGDFEALSKTELKDECVCWCNPQNEGCSPLQLYWKSAILWYPMFLGFCHPSFLSFCHLMPKDLRNSNLEAGPATRMMRFFTFEALEMTHTCCSLDKHPTWEFAIQHRSPETFQEIRLDEEEQQSAKLLDDLMEELVLDLREAVSNFGDFKEFIMGLWRCRMSELFAVDSEVVLNMRKTLSNVQTRNVPQSLKNIFGKDFEWLRGGCDESHGSDESSGSDVVHESDDF
jgi:hypothetical protein